MFRLFPFFPLVYCISVAFSINEQIPTIARTNQAYLYTFPLQTFSSSTGVTYSLSGCPSWLSLSANSLSGTPTAAGEFTCSLIATDSSGSATDAMTLLVSDAAAPTIAISLESQLSAIGSTNGNGGLMLSPGEEFTIKFSSNTFSSSSTIVAYYGTAGYHTPLPAWVAFDSSTITFSGTAPQLISGSLYYSFVLTATDTPGYSAINAEFQIIVTANQLSFNPSSYTINASYNSPVSFTVPLPTLNSATIATSNISSITSNITSGWLTFDTTSRLLSGTPGTGDSSTTVLVTVKDVYSDTAIVSVFVDLGDPLASTSTSTVTSTSTSSISTSASSLASSSAVSSAVSFSSSSDVSSSASSSSMAVSSSLAASSTSISTSTITSTSTSTSSTEGSSKATLTTHSSTTSATSTHQTTSTSSTPTSTPTSKKATLSRGGTVGVALGMSLPIVLGLTLASLFWSRRSHSYQPIGKSEN